jgi:DNA-binding transcriptional LysR family regulator
VDRLQEMSIFAAVAEDISFAAVSRRLGLSTATVTRAVAQLELRLGTLLVVRTTRQLRLTEAGLRFAADCRRLLQELQEAEDSAVGIHSSPRGSLTLTAPQVFGDLHVTPVMMEYLQQNPAVDIRALLVDRLVPLLDEGIDVAIRIGPLPDSSLTAIPVGQVRRVVVASPGYLAAQGYPDHPDQLLQRTTITAMVAESIADWRFQIAGEPYNLKMPSRLSVTSFTAAIHAAVDGWGLTQVSSYQVRAHLAAGRLVSALEGFEVPPQTVHVVYVEGRRGSSKVRSFVDFCVERLRRDFAL